MPPRRKTKKWPLYPDQPWRPGYIEGLRSRTEDRPDRAVLRIYGAHISLGMDFIPENEDRARRDGRAIVRDIERGKRPDPRKKAAKTEAVTPPSARTFAWAQKEFKDALLTLKPTDAADPILARRHALKVRQYKDAWRAVFPKDDYLTDDAVATAIRIWSKNPTGASKKQKPVSEGTADLHRKRIRRFIRFCIAHGWLTLNPFDGGGELTVQKVNPPKKKSLSNEEQKIFMRQVAIRGRERRRRHRHGVEQLATFVRCLGFSGMRRGECSTIRLEEYVVDRNRENYITADGQLLILNDTKNAKPGKITPPRVYPLAYLPHLRAALERQRPYAHSRDGYLFAWWRPDDQKRIGEILGDCFEKAGINERLDPAHIFRSIASAYWHELGLPDAVVARMLGHSEKINRENYTDEQTGRETLMRREAEEMTALLRTHLPRAQSRAQSRAQ